MTSFHWPLADNVAAAEFMKQHMKAIKTENPGISQSRAMQILSEKWKLSKEASAAQGEGVDDLVAGMGRLIF